MIERLTFVFKRLECLTSLISNYNIIDMVRNDEILIAVDVKLNQLDVVIKSNDCDDNRRILQAIYDLVYFYAYYD